MHAFLRTVLPVTATVLALAYQTACSSDGDDEATGGKGGSSGSGTGGKGGSSSGGSAGQGGTSTGGSSATGGGGTGGAAGATVGGAGGSSGGEDCNGMICPEGTFCSECYNFDNPDEPLIACIDVGTSC